MQCNYLPPLSRTLNLHVHFSCFKNETENTINKFRYQIKKQCLWYQSCLHGPVQRITIIFLIVRILIPSYSVLLIKKKPSVSCWHIEQQENKAVQLTGLRAYKTVLELSNVCYIPQD